MASSARDRILAALAGLEARYHITILMAVEAGSRVYNMESSDSDYDVRGVFIPRSPKHANMLRALHAPDATPLDITHFSDDRTIDIVLWDVRKAVGMLAQGKVPVLEWARSSIVYRTSLDWPSTLLHACNMSADVLSTVRHCTLRHYVGMLRNSMNEVMCDERVDVTVAASINTAADTATSAVASVRKALVFGRNNVADLVAGAHAALDALATLQSPAPRVHDAAAVKAVTAKQLCNVLMPAMYIAWMLQHDSNWPPLDMEKVMAQVVLEDDTVRKEAHGILVHKRDAATKHAPQPHAPAFEAWVKQVEQEAVKTLTAGRTRANVLPWHVLQSLVTLPEEDAWE